MAKAKASDRHVYGTLCPDGTVKNWDGRIFQSVAEWDEYRGDRSGNLILILPATDETFAVPFQELAKLRCWRQS